MPFYVRLKSPSELYAIWNTKFMLFIQLDVVTLKFGLKLTWNHLKTLQVTVHLFVGQLSENCQWKASSFCGMALALKRFSTVKRIPLSKTMHNCKSNFGSMMKPKTTIKKHMRTENASDSLENWLKVGVEFSLLFYQYLLVILKKWKTTSCCKKLFKLAKNH